MPEKDWIARYFAPLVTSGGAAGLTDDLALLSADNGQPVVVTVDAMVEGVHFQPSDPIESIARKLVRVNVSDIYSAGALPAEALLTLGWPDGRSETELAEFAEALGEELSGKGARLIGGDTVKSTGGLFLSLTLTGRCIGAAPVRRSGASAGQDLWVTGRIGAAWRGFDALQSGDTGSEWVSFYREPALPSASAAGLIAMHATAAMDISDGLLGDASQMAAASGCGVTIQLEAVPFAGEAKDIESMLRLATWGDDYQLLFTAEKSKRAQIQADAAESGVAIEIIGHVQAEMGISVTFDGSDVNLPETLAFEHGF